MLSLFLYRFFFPFRFLLRFQFLFLFLFLFLFPFLFPIPVSRFSRRPCFDRKISRPVIQIFATSSIFQPKTNLSLSSSFFNDTCCSKIPQVYVRCSFKLDKIPSYPTICVKVQCSLNCQDADFKFLFRNKPLLL